VAKKRLNLQFIYLYYGICRGRGLAENVKIPSYRGKGSKIA